LTDFALIESSGKALGLLLNTAKCEIISHSDIPSGLLVSNFVFVKPEDSVLLGAPILPGTALDESVAKRLSELHS